MENNQSRSVQALAIRQVNDLASMFNIKGTGQEVVDVLLHTAFRIDDEKIVSPEQMVALAVVAKQYRLNPFTKEIYAFPDKKKGVIPIVGVDGWARIINEHPAMNGMKFEYSDNIIKMDENSKPCPEWIECIIRRKDREEPMVIREYLDEVYRPPFEGNGKNGRYTINGPWQSHTKRFLRHKAMIQCARIAFGFAGIYDQDEAERIIEGQTIDAGYIEKRTAPKRPQPVKTGNTSNNSEVAEGAENIEDAEVVEIIGGEGVVPTSEKVDEGGKPEKTLFERMSDRAKAGRSDSPGNKTSEGAITFIKQKAESAGIDISEILETFSIGSLDGIDEETGSSIIKWIREKAR